jgi:peroxiredoxin
VPPQPT